ncbi:hypothetical protein GCM10010196_00920 [Agromyces mediolanus]|uniref:Uncharacterized protein n=1 Tax=Agromyces mediolanus TaxID=41986 RepID=A0A918F8V2_AGRME|nr:hypothetical protein GCM10010196_00920 [Agromyces mediolanus]GLJ73347.1 hypothetical protein GCM10017583_26050 [Agromyces mediolanus]
MDRFVPTWMRGMDDVALMCCLASQLVDAGGARIARTGSTRADPVPPLQTPPNGGPGRPPPG